MMAVVIDEVSVQVEPGVPEPQQQTSAQPAPNSTQIVRAQMAQVARRAARLRVD
jgi:hypothetical protein